jgi:hypothetical protein
MPHTVASALLDGHVLRGKGAHQLEVHAVVDRVSEIGLDALTPRMEGRQFGEHAPRASFVGASDRERALDPGRSGHRPVNGHQRDVL